MELWDAYNAEGIIGENVQLIYNCTQEAVNVLYKVYLCQCKMHKDAIVLQAGETIDYKWVTSEELIEFIGSKSFINPSPEQLSEYIRSNQSDMK